MVSMRTRKVKTTTDMPLGQIEEIVDRNSRPTEDGQHYKKSAKGTLKFPSEQK
jgi:hypothetical protein